MNMDEYLLVTNQAEPRGITADVLGGEDRTLLRGYTCDRDTWHVYLKDGDIHLLVYSYPDVVVRHEARDSWMNPEDLVPDKRVYPESTCFRFARELQVRGVRVPYLRFDADRFRTVGSDRFLGPVM